jgi:hypothetical protein
MGKETLAKRKLFFPWHSTVRDETIQGEGGCGWVTEEEEALSPLPSPTHPPTHLIYLFLRLQSERRMMSLTLLFTLEECMYLSRECLYISRDNT